MTHLSYNSQLRTETDPATIATLIRKGWAETVLPTYDPATQHAPEWIDGEWIVRALTEEELAAVERKTWPNVTEFWAEFTDAEKYGIETSTDPTTIVMRADLKLWLADVWSDDLRIQTGMARLVELNILTQERHDEILSI